MMTEYELRRLSQLIIEGLCRDDRFMEKVAKSMPKQKKMIRVREAAKILGISVWTVRDIAAELGGQRKGNAIKGQWQFELEGLVERYQDYCRRC